ncbi:MAG: hypothetical protein HOK95_05105 [Candidatus Marinimicrobia bacterium]|nr:hypothetical protein [Candidatus Neomarinimicrobiota bacterium]
MNIPSKQTVLFIFIMNLAFSLGHNKLEKIWYYENTQGVLIHLKLESTIKAEDISETFSENTNLYFTLNNVYSDSAIIGGLKPKPPITEMRIENNETSLKIGLLMKMSIVSFQVFYSNTCSEILIQVQNNKGQGVIDSSTKSDGNFAKSIILVSDEGLKGMSFKDAFTKARKQYGKDQYFSWKRHWYNTNIVTKKRKEKQKAITAKKKIVLSESSNDPKQSINKKDDKIEEANVLQRIVTKKTTGIIGTEYLPRLPKTKIKSDTKAKIIIYCNISGLPVLLDGKAIGITPIKKSINVRQGFHNLEIMVPEALESDLYSIESSNKKEIYIHGGKTQKLRFNFPEQLRKKSKKIQ